MIDKARILSFLRKNDEAINVITVACEIDPNNKDAWLLRSEILNNLGKIEASRIAYQKAQGLTNIDVQKESKVAYVCPTCGGIVPMDANRCPQCGLPIINNRHELPPGTVGILKSSLKKVELGEKKEDYAQAEQYQAPQVSTPIEQRLSDVLMIDDQPYKKFNNTLHGVKYVSEYDKLIMFLPIISGVAITSILFILFILHVNI
jgi:tetratricopeptide (TPR) repeat protein